MSSNVLFIYVFGNWENGSKADSIFVGFLFVRGQNKFRYVKCKAGWFVLFSFSFFWRYMGVEVGRTVRRRDREGVKTKQEERKG